ncbi:MAG: Maf family protein [Acidimicrobiales bacterium]
MAPEGVSVEPVGVEPAAASVVDDPAPVVSPARPRLVLASASPRRRRLLADLGITVEVAPVDVDECARPGETPAALARRLAETKAVTGHARRPGRSAAVVIGGDTVIDLDGEILGKPDDPADAARMLRRLSGRSHQVVSAVAVADGQRCVVDLDRSTVWLRDLDDAEIEAYVATGEPLDVAGSYAIQGRAGVFVERIEGTYHGIVGLPISTLDRLSRELGWPLSDWAGSP